MKKILTLLLMLFLFVGNANAACELTDPNGFCLITDPATHIEIHGTTYFGADLEEGVHPGGTYFKVSNKDEIIYCSDGVMPTDELSEDIETFDKNCSVVSLNKNSLIYSYEYGYGEYKTSGYDYNSNYLTGVLAEDYYITQTAVWNFCPPDNYLDMWAWFSNYDFTNKTFKGITGNETIIKISNLINDATAAANATPSLNVSASNLTMNLTSDGKYYISDGIKLTGSYLNDVVSVTVTGANNAFVTKDKNATSGNSTFFDATSPSVSETVYVKVPVESITNDKTNIKLHVQSKSAFNDDSKIIECHITKETVNYQQPMIKYVPNYITVEDEITLSAKKYPVKISKTDNEGNVLSGATLVIKQGDKEIATWKTSDEAKTILLAPGTYTLSETKAPNGYILNNNVITFTVTDEDVELEEINITNDPIIITVSKTAVKQEGELSGATLRITDKDGNIAKDIDGNDLEWVSSDKPKSFHVAAGTYILEEIKAPEGYELSDKKIEFTVHEDGTVTTEEGLLIKKEVVVKDNLIVFENTPEPEEVQTGSLMVYIAGTLCLISLGVSIYFIVKRKEI